MLQVIGGCDGKVFVAQTGRVGLYTIAVDIVFEHGLSLALLFTEAEAGRLLRNWRFSSSHDTDQSPLETPWTDAGQTLDKCSLFFKLPAEIREHIYSFALPSRDLSIGDFQVFNRHTFPTALGDPSGFLFQLGQEPGVLHVNRQMRREALPFAYRNTNVKLDDMDDVIRFLIAVGQIGRDNMTSLQFPWMSRSETAHRWEEDPQAHDNDSRLPSLHVPSCVQLVKMCKRLKMLRVCLDGHVLENNMEMQLVTDPGLAALFALTSLRKLEIVDHADEPLELHRPATCSSKPSVQDPTGP